MALPRYSLFSPQETNHGAHSEIELAAQFINQTKEAHLMFLQQEHDKYLMLFTTLCENSAIRDHLSSLRSGGVFNEARTDDVVNAINHFILELGLYLTGESNSYIVELSTKLQRCANAPTARKIGDDDPRKSEKQKSILDLMVALKRADSVINKEHSIKAQEVTLRCLERLSNYHLHDIQYIQFKSPKNS